MKTITSKSAAKPKRLPRQKLVGAKRAVVPEVNKDKIKKLLAKKKELLAKHKAVLADIEKSLKALGYKPSVAGRRLLIK